MEPSPLRTAIDLVLSDVAVVLGPDRVGVAITDDVATWSELESTNPDLLDLLTDPRRTVGVAGWTYVPGETGYTGIHDAWDEPPVAQVVRVAEAIQEAVMEGNRDFGCAFPPCPVHHVHPLWPEVREMTAIWVCLDDGSIAVEIGTFDTGLPLSSS